MSINFEISVPGVALTNFLVLFGSLPDVSKIYRHQGFHLLSMQLAGSRKVRLYQIVIQNDRSGLSDQTYAAQLAVHNLVHFLEIQHQACVAAQIVFHALVRE